jgi:hypothetical protein
MWYSPQYSAGWNTGTSPTGNGYSYGYGSSPVTSTYDSSTGMTYNNNTSNGAYAGYASSAYNGASSTSSGGYYGGYYPPQGAYTPTAPLPPASEFMVRPPGRLSAPAQRPSLNGGAHA